MRRHTCEEKNDAEAHLLKKPPSCGFFVRGSCGCDRDFACSLIVDSADDRDSAVANAERLSIKHFACSLFVVKQNQRTVAVAAAQDPITSPVR